MSNHPPLIDIFTRGLSWKGFVVDWRSSREASIEFGKPLSMLSAKTRPINENTGVTIQRLTVGFSEDDGRVLSEGWIVATGEKPRFFAVRKGKIVGMMLKGPTSVRFGKIGVLPVCSL